MPFSVKPWSVPFDLLKRTAAEWSSDNATRWSASVAFYTLRRTPLDLSRGPLHPDTGPKCHRQSCSQKL